MTEVKTKAKATPQKTLPTAIEAREVVVTFEEQYKWPGTGHRITFDGPQFQDWIYKTLPVSAGLVPMDRKTAKSDGIHLDSFVFYMRPFPLWKWGSKYENTHTGIPFIPFLDISHNVPMRCCLQMYRRSQVALCAFSTEINIPVLAKPDKFNCNRLEPWMSLTPNEVMTQRGQIRRSRNNTALAGLGLGWAARKILERKQVKHLTIYEKSQAIIDYFGASLIADYPDKVTLVCADAYEVDWQKHDVSLWDIWEFWGDAAWDRKFENIRMELEAKGKTCVGWGYSPKVF